ncbi:MAG: hypothetical protein ACTSPY_07145 [Candidatus Helarchaeota archaeon]
MNQNIDMDLDIKNGCIPEKDEDFKLTLLITNSLQRDFVEELEDYSNKIKVHIDKSQCKHLWWGTKKKGQGKNQIEQFFDDMMKTIENMDEEKYAYHFIHIRDWHDITDPDQKDELDDETGYGAHCLKGTNGARFIKPIEDFIKKHREYNLIVNSVALNSFIETDLDMHLNSLLEIYRCNKNQVKIGIIGVVVNIKILFLVYDLTVRYEFSRKNVYVCKDLSAGLDDTGYKEGINYISKILKLKDNVCNLEKFKSELNLL